ncbi:NACHT, LRR and PYD domains-containing protein 12-like [Engraulis encrasicolus]|uniref:NACHT, LRR and PYD domains-containing protein 12-like n=1 Tax=Engraulis encrasicolus TaxID=184585 RepID=UPI002FD39D40
MSQRPESSAQSSVSLKSDWSKDGNLPNFRQEHTHSKPRVMSQRPESSAQSSVSLKSDESKDGNLPNFRREDTHSKPRVMSQRPESSAQSSVSLKSDWSKDGNLPNFRGESVSPEQRVMSQRPESSAQSSVSLKSDWSKDGNLPNFRRESMLPEQRDDWSKDGDHPMFRDDRSKDGDHPMFREEDTSSKFRKHKRSRQPDSSGRNEQQDLAAVFQVLEKKINTFVKSELQRLKRILSPDYQEDFEKREEDERDAREGAFKMALHFLWKMDRGDLAGKLRENELDVLCQDEMKRNLRTKYQKVFEGIPKQGESALLEKIYTEIYITEGGSGKVNEEHEVRQIESRSKTPAGLEKPIRCSDLFKPLPGQDKPSRRVMMKGVAGIGKTVSIQKYILDWTKANKDNKEIHLIFPLPFRELNLLKDKQHSLMDLLHHFFPELKQLRFANQEKYNILFIFDGLDECRLPLDFQKNESWSDVAGVTSLDVLLTNLIKGNLLPSALLWITSRPAAASQIPPECVDLVTEIHGFNDTQKEEYFWKRISDETLASRIVSHITSSRSLHIMCHIPVFCWITACVLEMILSSSESKQLPKTLTEMYTFFLIFQTKQKSQKYDDVHDPDPQWNQDLILDLGKLAYNQLEKGNLIFYEDDMRGCGIDVREAAVRSGVCTQIFREESGIFQTTVFCFIHLSIQEYLAALYVFLMMATKTKDVLSVPQSPPGEESMTILHKNAVDKALEYKDGRFDLFLRFLLGLSLDSNQTLLHGLLQRGQKQTGNDKTISYIKEKIREVPSSERVINLFHCLNELNDHSLVEEIQSFLSAGTLAESQLSPGQWSALVFVLLTSDQILDVFDLKKYIRSDKGLLRLKPVVEESQTLLLDSCSLSEASCTTLASVLCNASSKVKKLYLSGNRIGDVGVKELCSGLKNPNCGLATLRLSGCSVTGEGFAALASALQSNPSSHLEELDLRGNDPGHSEVKLLIDLLQDPACKLQTLRLLESDAADQACVYLTSILHENPLMLTELNLNGKIPGDSGVKQFCALLGDPHCRIKSLRLDSCSLSETSCKTLASVLCNASSKVKKLDLSGNRIGDVGVKELCSGLKNPICALETLRLSCCGVTGEGYAALASALQSNPSSHLEDLDLRGNDPGHSEVKLLIDLLQDRVCKLQTLRLLESDAADQACVYLTSILHENPLMRTELDLDEKIPGDSGVKQFCALLGDPHCRIMTLRLVV